MSHMLKSFAQRYPHEVTNLGQQVRQVAMGAGKKSWWCAENQMGL
jgi:hypothetical protein